VATTGGGGLSPARFLPFPAGTAGVALSGGSVDRDGPLAQLVAHLHDAQGVTGSSPVRPTLTTEVDDLMRAKGKASSASL